ncbi:MAG: SIMPL domain-containing protein [Rubrimonas sp.]|uniref:SIMPL domain-containing protein n=1 Tax=Rubrimonas sp. TaxID=2036015 RepID=UPI002FDE7FB5
MPVPPRPRAAALALGLAAMLAASAGQARADAAPRTLRVAGEGISRAAPDIAQAVFGATVEAPTAEEAAAEAARRMRDILAALRALGLPDADLRTVEISLSPVHARDKGEGAPRLVGYVARHRLSVTARELSGLAPAIDAALAAGATDVDAIRFDVADSAALRDAARRAAVADAVATARLMAEAAGETLGPMLSLSLGHDYAEPRPVAYRASADAAGTPVAPGTLSLSATVEAVFALE